MIKLAAVQFSPILRDLDSNMHRIRTYLENIDADLIVFPELATCGYAYTSAESLRQYAVETSSADIEELDALCRKVKRRCVLGFAERAGEKLYNSSVFLGAPGERKVYRKTHLFYRESQVFDPGNTGFFSISDQELDLNIGMMICYDWRFPESARTLALAGADLVVCPSNLVTHLWTKVMPARAIENKVYLAVANRIGQEMLDDTALQFNGKSGIWSFEGDLVASAGPEEETVLMACIEPRDTRNKSFNEFNNIFADRRPDMYA